MSASMTLLLKEVKDATECPICTETFNSPKMLPCFHTFCLKCIETYGIGKREGDVLTCPLCRSEFKVPVGGLSKLRGNFFLERLISAVDSVPGSPISQAFDCDVCLIGKKCNEAASSFCVECQQSMCDQCSNIHGSMTISSTHHLSPIGDVSSREAMKKKLRKHFCKTHPAREIEFYCRDCKTAVCGACSTTKHNKHDICDIAEIAEESKKGFKIFADDASIIMRNIKKRSEKVSEQLDSFTDSMEQVETSIIRRGEDIKRMVDKQTNDLLGELKSRKTSIFKNLETLQEDLQRDQLICDSFKQFCTKIIAEADHVEIVSVADELATRAAEQLLNAKSIPELDICPQLEFIPSDFEITGNQQNVVGKLVETNERSTNSISKVQTPRLRVTNERNTNPISELQTPRLRETKERSANPVSKLKTPRLRNKLPTTGSVQGITSLNDELYIVTSDSSDIDVYDIDTLAHRRKIKVEGLFDGWDIVAHANVLYVSERRDKLIHRIQLSSDEISSNWSVNSKEVTMSINKRGNIVVSCFYPNKIIEYTPTGSCVRQIQVDAIDGTIVGLKHAIQLDDDRFVICYTTTTQRRVCIINSDSRMMKSYGGGPGSGIGQMDWPCYLAIDRNGFILVADYNNKRIIQLNASLEFIREFLPGSVGQNYPHRIHLHENKKKLYIAAGGKPNITVFDL